MKIRFVAAAAAILLSGLRLLAVPDSPREKILINNDWTFAYGHAADRLKDFGHGTEYFTYLTKVRSNNENKGPIMPDFDDSAWQKVSLPHDWVVDLPYSGDASHSHGYKTVGWKYPETSVGWYRKHVFIPEADRGKRILIEFEGIFRDSEVYCNGIYAGHERSGYASRTYDLTEYIDFGADNLITVRCDASLEEGWFYEGAGIYRNVYLHKTSSTAIAPYGVTLKDCRFNSDRTRCTVVTDVNVNALPAPEGITIVQTLIDNEGRSVATTTGSAKDTRFELEVRNPVLWSLDNTYLYTLRTCIYKAGSFAIEDLLDKYDLKVGIRSIGFGPGGFLLNGRRVELKGCDLHLDHAGVGTAVPDELWRYKLLKLKEYGFNAIRSSHNPASPAMLDLCDELGMLVIDENRMMGIDEEHFDLIERMIKRDAHHPSVILWSIGNEEWAIEYSPKGGSIARRMVDFVHSIDTSRPVTYGNCSGREMPQMLDVFGYNYIAQNAVEDYHRQFPDKCAVGTEETSGCGTRGKYVTDPSKGWMLSINRSGVDADPNNGSDTGMQLTPDGKIENVIERGWKYYAARPWLGGLFYWTGFDYRGEPNPMAWPATGSQFGILDYCGFPKDEAFYLRSCWVSEPQVHISADWSAGCTEGQIVDVWVFSNCEEVQLSVNGKNVGKKKPMPKDGHLSWNVPFQKAKLTATGFVNGKKTITTTLGVGEPYCIEAVPSKTGLVYDGQDVVVVDITVKDSEGCEVRDADVTLGVTVSDNVTILGWGNGDPGFKVVERPVAGSASGKFSIKTFSGKAQVILRSVSGAAGPALVSFSGLPSESLRLD